MTYRCDNCEDSGWASVTDGVCSIEGCGRAIRHKGLCNRHYIRLRTYGDPLGGRTYHGEPMEYFRSRVLGYDGDDCLFWPYTRNDQGYGQLWVRGKIKFVHRLSCEEENGPPPSKAHVAAHECGNGHLGCVTKRHLNWKTQAENMQDAFRHGTIKLGEDHPGAKLTTRAVIAIRKAKGAKTSSELASEFGVSVGTICDVVARRAWQHIE